MAKNDHNQVNYTKVEIDSKDGIAAMRDLTRSIDKYEKELKDVDKESDKYQKTTKKLNSLLKQKESAMKTGTMLLQKDSIAHKNSTAAIQAQINALQQELRVMDMSSVAYKQKQLQVQALSASMHQGARATGLASTSAMELGRVVSDAPYGIRGMANNVSQLTSLLFQGAGAMDEATGKTIGLRGAIKGMWSAMMGPLGIMIAIQAVIAALDYFVGSATKAEEASDDLGNAWTNMQGDIRTATDNLEVLDEVMKDGTSSTRQQTNALHDLKAMGYDPAIDALDDFIDRQKQLIILEASADLIKDQLKKLVDDKSAMGLLNDVATETYIKAEKAVIAQQKVLEALTNPQAQAGAAAALSLAKDARTESLRVLGELAEDRSKMSGFIDEDSQRFKDLLKQILGLRDVIETGGGGSSRADRLVKDYLGKLLDMEGELNKHNDRLNDIITVNEREVLKITHDAQKRDLKLKLENYKEQEVARHDAYVKKQQAIIDNNKSTATDKANSNAAIIAAAIVHRQNLEDAENGYTGVANVLDSTQLVERMKLDNALNEMTAEQQMKEREMQIEQDAWVNDNYEVFQGYANDKRIAVQEDIIAASQWKVENTALSHEAELEELEKQRIAKKEIFDLELEDTISIEDAKRSVMDASFGLASKGLKSISQLSKKNSKEQKALALLSIAANTAEGIVNGIILAQKTAKASPPAAAPAIFASMVISQTTAVLGAAAQAKAILQGGTGGGPTAGAQGGEASGFNPNFNVVGNSNQNQLAQSISEQSNEPTRAYVVYEDIAEAGEVTNATEEIAGL